MNIKLSNLFRLFTLFCATIANVYAEDTRVGISVGSTGMLSADYEIRYGSQAIHYSAGLMELVPTASFTWKHYVSIDHQTFYYGAGIWGLIAVLPEEAGMLTLVRMPLGLEWKTRSKHYYGFELSLNYPLSLSTFYGPERHLRPWFFIMPGIYYRVDY